MSNRSDDMETGSGSKGLRFEILLASTLLAFGLFALPAIVYFVGAALLGPYIESDAPANSVALFYRNFFADLAAPSGRAWLIAIGPLLVIALFRLAFVGQRSVRIPTSRNESTPKRTAAPPQPSRASPRAPQQKPRGARRVEPRIGGD
jgi:hypothetical protein